MNLLEQCENVVVPESAMIKRIKKNRYGTIEGLDESELVGADELERLVFIREFAPILSLPIKKKKTKGIIPAVDEDGGLDWGAFGTVDFDKYAPKLNKMGYKISKLNEELEMVLIMLGIVCDRISGHTKNKVFRYLRMGGLDVEDIADWDMWSAGRLYLRALRLQEQVKELKIKQRERKLKQSERFWVSI